MEERNYKLYVHISPSGKRYYGITGQEAKKRWANGKGYKGNNHFTNAINKYGWNNFEHIIIAKGLTEDEAKWLEIELIREFDTTNQDKGYNQSLGGEGASGCVRSEKQRKEHSKRMTGENNPMYGKSPRDNMTEEEKAEYNRKIKENHADFSGKNHPMYGKHHTEETRKKLSNYFRENHAKSKKVICLETGDVFNSIRQTAEWLGVKHHSGVRYAIKNNRKYKNYTFMYYEDWLDNQEAS